MYVKKGVNRPHLSQEIVYNSDSDLFGGPTQTIDQ